MQPGVIEFDASSQGLPVLAEDVALVKIEFGSCPSSDLRMELLSSSDGCERNGPRDVHGMTAASWWSVRCTGVPDRVLRLDDSRSMLELLRRYGFQDASGCVNHQRIIASYAPSTAACRPLCVSPERRLWRGVPQFYPRSGVCWFAAFCWVSFANAQVRALLLAAIQDPSLRKLCEGAIYCREDAEALRKRLWYDYAVGDDVTLPPEMDGRNGFSEFCVWCAQLHVPMIRFEECDGRLVEMRGESLRDRRGKSYRLKGPSGSEQEHLLAIRFVDGDHSRKFPACKRIRHAGRRYRLVGFYAGQKKCGHQIGIASPSGNWRDWAISDADLHKSGISPVFIQFDKCTRQEDWWRAWKVLVHITKFGSNCSELCNHSPWNPDNNPLEQYRTVYKGTAPGTNSIDMVYMSAEDL